MSRFPSLPLPIRRLALTGGLAVLAVLPLRAQTPAATSEARHSKEATAAPEAGSTVDSTESLTAEEQRGKQIYLTGESPSGEPVTALMGANAVEVPASTLPCANCHARDGKGNPEGGVNPSNLTWDALTKPYGVRHEGGREHPPYTDALLKRAIAMGVDPAGNELHAAMPRYRMTLADMAALVAYIHKLGNDQDPGVTADTLHLGTLLPPDGMAKGVSEAIESVLRAYVADVDSRGGLYGRRLELHAHRLVQDPSQRRADVEAFLDQTPIFAMVGAFIAGSDTEIPALMAEREIPLVGPFTLHPQTGFPVNRQVFYLLAGLATQGRVLVDAAAERHPHQEGDEEARPKAALVYPTEGSSETVRAIERQAKRHDWPLQEVPVGPEPVDPAELTRRLAGVEVLFLFEPGAARKEVLDALPGVEIYLPGSFAGAALDSAAATAGRVFFAFPSLPADQTPEAVETYRHLVATYSLPRASLTTQLATLAAAEVLEEGIKQAGREVSQEKLIAALEKLYEFTTGIIPPVSFNPNRRIGAEGAYLVTLDPEHHDFRPLGSFRTPEGGL